MKKLEFGKDAEAGFRERQAAKLLGLSYHQFRRLYLKYQDTWAIAFNL